MSDLITSTDEYTKEEVAKNGNGVYGGKRHDEICEYFESQGYSESAINDISMGVWKGIEAEKKVWQEKIKPLESEINKLKEEIKKKNNSIRFELDALGGYLLSINAPVSVIKEFSKARKLVESILNGDKDE